MPTSTTCSLVLSSLLAASPLAASNAQPGGDRWELVFEDDFNDPGSPLADWMTFGDAGSTDAGAEGR